MRFVLNMILSLQDGGDQFRSSCLNRKLDFQGISEWENVNVALFSYTRAFRDGPRNFKPWSRDEADPLNDEGELKTFNFPKCMLNL
ncbi:hypothetical protein TNCV_2856891 [Trichonephila clavipes]|nr:hypothetical protein TNCV_2856891 [Trichonephila clavipes]